MSKYYQSVVETTKDYLGPAAERFVRRQVEFHLNKPAEAINKQDVLQLRDSLCVALSLLINDKQVVDQARRAFNLIAEGSN